MGTRRSKTPGRWALRATLWFSVGEENLGGHGRMALLRAIAAEGSITRAAKAFGMSYKAAWDAVDAMNRLAGDPLVERSTGGRGGGSTRLTAHGERLVERFAQVDAAHRRFVALLDQGGADLDQDFSLLRILNMKTSARNQFIGTVSALRSGAVNDEVELSLDGGVRLVAIITRDSTEALGLRTRQTAIALVQSSAVLLATGLDEATRVSARNQLPGTVASVLPGAVNSEVVLDLDGGGQIVATITQASVAGLGLAPGVRALALVQASDVVLAVTA